MQTGYDNFWIYQNSRHEPVHNLQKNDNYNYQVVPDSYKQNGGYPSNTIVTLNNVASSENGHYSTGPHYIWPTSVYTLPFNSSYANNIQPQMYPTQTNNFSYSTQHSQPKIGMRNVNVPGPQKNLDNNQKHAATRLPPITADAESARIRVKDVFTLNNNSMYSSVADNNAIQAQKNKQFPCPLNYTANNFNRTCEFETNLPASKQFSSSYVQTGQIISNNQPQAVQYSGYQQNSQISSQHQNQSDGSRERRAFQPVGVKSKSHLLTHLLRRSRNQEDQNVCNPQVVNERAIVQANGTNHSNPLKSQINPQINTERTNNINYLDSSSRANENLTSNSYNSTFAYTQNQNQGQVCQATSLNQIQSVEETRKKQLNEQVVTSSAKNFANRVNSLENNLVKITIPHTGQSTYINPYEPTSGGNNNCDLSLPSLLESSEDVYHETLKKNNTPNYQQNALPERSPARRQSCNISPGRNRAFDIPPQSVSNNCNSTTRNSNFGYYNCTENTSDNFNAVVDECNENSNEFIENSPEIESISNSESNSSDVTIKKEISLVEVDDSSITEIEQDVTVSKALEEIKTEKYLENFEVEQKRQSDVRMKEPFFSNSDHKSVDSNKREECTVVSKTVPKPKTTPTGCHCTSELGTSKNTLIKKDKTEIIEEDQEANYVCKINKDKLDLLIEFLNRDEETCKTTKPDICVSKIFDDCKNKKEGNLSCSRRKLSKARIVKNKNNSREMVSLVSHKTSRGESCQNSPQTPKTDGNSNNEDEQKTSCCAVSQKEFKSCNSSQEIEGKKSNSKSEPEIENMSDGSQSQNSSVDDEKNIVNIMLALQNLKSHFCLSCTLVSPIESFWINVVSGELRCLNCFKKMTSKTDDNILKSKRTNSDSEGKRTNSDSEGKRTNSDSESKRTNDSDVKFTDHQKETENKKETNCNKCSCGCKIETPDVHIKEEVVKKDEIFYVNDDERISKSKNTSVPRKRSIDEPKKSRESEERGIKQKENTTFKTTVEEGRKTEVRTKRKLSLKEDPDNTVISEEKSLKRSYSEESQVAVNIQKNLLNCFGKRNGSRDEMENERKDRKPSNQSKEQRTSMSKDGVEQEARSTSEKSIKSSLLKEEDFSEVCKKDKIHSKDSRKRGDSKEESGFHKVRISEEEMLVVSSIKSPPKEGVDSHKLHPEGILKKSINESYDKSSRHSSKPKTKNSNPQEDSEKRMPTLKMFDIEKSTETSDQLRKRRKSMEDIIPRKVRATEEHSKLPKPSYEKPKTTITKESSKHVTVDERKNTKDDTPSPKSQSENKTRRNSTLKENLNSPEHPEIKHETSTPPKEKKYVMGKLPKNSQKTSEKVSFECIKSSPNGGDKHQKSTASSKPLKESQRTESEVKISSPGHVKKKEGHEHRAKQPEERNSEKNKTDKHTEEDKLGKKKVFEQEVSKLHKLDKSQNTRSKKDRALECIFGRKKEEVIISEYKKIHKDNPPSPKFLEKLLEKSKKLPWDLLTKS